MPQPVFKRDIVSTLLFMWACQHSGQIVPYQKFLGQLLDAGNTTTLAHYQRLLEGARLIWGIPKYHGSAIRHRASSPKWMVLNTALMTATSGMHFFDWRSDAAKWGRLVESAVGAHLINTSFGRGIDVFYWRDHQKEVDFVLRQGNDLLAVEVKSGLFKTKHPGLEAFKGKFPEAQLIWVGREGIPVEEFLKYPAERWI